MTDELKPPPHYCPERGKPQPWFSEGGEAYDLWAECCVRAMLHHGASTCLGTLEIHDLDQERRAELAAKMRERAASRTDDPYSDICARKWFHGWAAGLEEAADMVEGKE